MNKTKRLAGMLGFVVCGMLPGVTAYGQPSASVELTVGLPAIEIRAESDFYEPLTPYGRWQVVGAYGRCWIPGHVEADWRPYCEGYWELTDDGWYWVSDEPWAWATYHYGRWDLSDEFGWYWVPQTRWAPAWVSWHSGGGYIGWTPLFPSGVRVISPRAYVFVEERHFLEPVRRTTLVVNNTTIINKTVIKEAPATAAIEKVSARKLQAVPVQELRRKTEAAVVAKQPAPAATGEKKLAPTGREAVPGETKPAAPAETKPPVAHTPPQVEKPAPAAHEPPAPAPEKPKAPSETHKPAPAAPEPKYAPLPEAKPAPLPEAKPEAKPELKPKTKPEAKPEAKPKAKPEDKE